VNGTRRSVGVIQDTVLGSIQLDVLFAACRWCVTWGEHTKHGFNIFLAACRDCMARAVCIKLSLGIFLAACRGCMARGGCVKHRRGGPAAVFQGWPAGALDRAHWPRKADGVSARHARMRVLVRSYGWLSCCRWACASSQRSECMCVWLILWSLVRPILTKSISPGHCTWPVSQTCWRPYAPNQPISLACFWNSGWLFLDAKPWARLVKLLEHLSKRCTVWLSWIFLKFQYRGIKCFCHQGVCWDGKCTLQAAAALSKSSALCWCNLSQQNDVQHKLPKSTPSPTQILEQQRPLMTMTPWWLWPLDDYDPLMTITPLDICASALVPSLVWPQPARATRAAP